MTPHRLRLWCNCDDCVRFRGHRLPDEIVRMLEASLRAIEERPIQFLVGTPPPFFTAAMLSDAELQHVRATQQIQEDIYRACAVPMAAELPLTTRDVRFLRGLGINPWK